MSTEEMDLCQAVAAWLNYKSLVGLKGQLSESMLNAPIAEFLAARHGSEVNMEENHPAFSTGRRGRPKQIDFVRRRRGEKTWHVAIECKYQSDTPQRLIDDICRLAVLAQCGKKIGNPKRLFLLAGERSESHEPLDVRINSEGKRISVFDSVLSRITESDTVKRPAICDLSGGQKKLFENFCDGYKSSIPSKIKTERIGFGESGRYACSIWRISSVKGTKLIDVEDLRK
ncbi:MAG: hypothetical protein P1U53_04265 [Sulfitobacter sp.]|nr:hypothetical protein [Sulfitobacter sp.]